MAIVQRQANMEEIIKRSKIVVRSLIIKLIVEGGGGTKNNYECSREVSEKSTSPGVNFLAQH